MQLKAGPNKDHASEGNNNGCFSKQTFPSFKIIEINWEAEGEWCAAVQTTWGESSSGVERQFLRGESVLVGSVRQGASRQG